MAVLGDRLARAERAVVGEGKARGAASEGLVDVEPASIGVHLALVGVAEAVGGDPGAARVDEDHEAVVDVRPVAEVTGLAQRADRDPRARARVEVHEVHRGQGDAVDLREERRLAPVARDAPHPARRQQARAQEVALRCEREAVGRHPWLAVAEEVGARAVRRDPRHASSEVRGEHRAVGAAGHALGPHHLAPESTDGVEGQGLDVRHRFRSRWRATAPGDDSAAARGRSNRPSTTGLRTARQRLRPARPV